MSTRKNASPWLFVVCMLSLHGCKIAHEALSPENADGGGSGSVAGETRADSGTRSDGRPLGLAPRADGSVEGNAYADGGSVEGNAYADGGSVEGNAYADGGSVEGNAYADGGSVEGNAYADGGFEEGPVNPLPLADGGAASGQ